MKLIGLSGSLRAGSLNTKLLQEAGRLCPAGVELIEGSIRGVPLYDGDVERDQGIPSAVETLKDQVAGSDGLLLVSPEYNNSIPGVFKNAIDWMSRPGSDIERVFAGRPTAVIGVSGGRFGTVMAQAAWLPVLRLLKTDPWFGGRFLLGGGGTAFDDQGRLTDPETERMLTEFMAGFAEFCRQKAGG